MSKSKYIVNESKRTVTYTIGSLNEAEKAEISEYKEAGYEIVIKPKKAKRSGVSLTNEAMKEAAKGKPWEKELLTKIENKENHLKIQKWFKDQQK